MLRLGGVIMLKLSRACLLLGAISLIGGCGTYVPHMEEIIDQREVDLDAGGVLERNIKIQVYCELKAAVLAVTDPNSPEYIGIYRKQQYSSALPDDWGVELTLTLQVDENSSANPSVALNTFSPPSFTLGLGATLSSTATRVDKFTFFYLIKDLRTTLGRADRCFFDEAGTRRDIKLPGSSLLILSDLRIKDWLKDALNVEANYKSQATDPAKKDDIYSYDVKFVVVTNGIANPAWKLVRVSTNQSGSPLLGAGRTRSHDLLMTFGPTEKPKNGAPRTLSTSAANSHLASEIGTAVANSIRSFPPFTVP
jgi:hypothetical protein